MSVAATTTTASSGLTLGPKVPTDREKLAGAAKQFEAIFLRQMLASARAAVSASCGSGAHARRASGSAAAVTPMRPRQ